MLDSTAIQTLAVNTLENNKAQNINLIDITELTDIADAMIICTATSTRHATAMAGKLLREMKNAEVQPLGVEGLDKGDWILVDLQDVIVHIMLADIREFYNLEKLWEITEKKRRDNEA